MKKTDFPRILSEFLLNELPVVRNLSNNTISSYKDTYVRLLTYFRDVLSISPERIKVSDLSASQIVEFLNWLERECENSISTRNQRLAAIHSLFRYMQLQLPEYMFQCQQILGIPYKKADKKLIGYLSEEQTKTLLSSPNISIKKGRRDQMLLTLLYDSGARVQELADLRVGELRLDNPAQVKLTGKGRKTRNVPLMDKTVALLRQYLSEQGIDNPMYFEHPFFFNSQGKKLTRQGISYILKKYATECEITEISTHKIRHTKAMHLTEANINPIFIRDFLGHTDLKVTEIYSKTSIKMKKAALDKMNSGKNIIPEKSATNWTEDKTLMDWLNGLKI